MFAEATRSAYLWLYVYQHLEQEQGLIRNRKLFQVAERFGDGRNRKWFGRRASLGSLPLLRLDVPSV